MEVKFSRFALLGVLVVMVLVAGCVGEKKISNRQQLKETPFTPAASPIDIDLTFSNLPSLGQTAELVADIISVRDAPNTTVNIILPEGFELIRGNLSWKGSLAKNQSLQLKTMIKAVKNGEWVIEGSVKSVVSEDSWWMDKDTIYVSIKDEEIKISELPFSPNKTTQQTKIE